MTYEKQKKKTSYPTCFTAFFIDTGGTDNGDTLCMDGVYLL